jgi:hypothetical protein
MTRSLNADQVRDKLHFKPPAACQTDEVLLFLAEQINEIAAQISELTEFLINDTVDVDVHEMPVIFQREDRP